jgi:Zn-dependent membrane protease YugP
MTASIMIVSLIFLGISMLISMILKGKFSAYSTLPLANRMSGKEVAEKMLRENGIHNVKVISVEGILGDHYNPLNKTVNLSPDIYNGRNIASAAVAAHECGHALQHAAAYSRLMMRSKMVPAVQFSSVLVNGILMIGVIMAIAGKSPAVLLIGIILMGITVIFSLITLPVEFDASRRALAWLKHNSVANSREYPKAKDALKWAALTYVVAALAAVVTLAQYILIYIGSRDRN